MRYRNLAILKSRSLSPAGCKDPIGGVKEPPGLINFPVSSNSGEGGRGRGGWGCLPGRRSKSPETSPRTTEDTHGSTQDPGNEGKVLFFRSFVRPFHPRYCGVPFVVYPRFPSPWISYILGRLNSHDQRQNSRGKVGNETS